VTRLKKEVGEYLYRIRRKREKKLEGHKPHLRLQGNRNIILENELREDKR
jgi:hypothetical protein